MNLKYNLIAHRGYFNLEKNIPENSIKAFKQALKYNYIIEFDVRMTKDKKLIVFHDDNLKRCCGIDKDIDECSYDELKKLYLFSTTSKIPLFKEVLDIISGKVPIIIETKGKYKYGELEELIEKELTNYEGEYAIQSFNPISILWYKKNKPNIKRGLLESIKSKERLSLIQRLLPLGCILKCDFYSLDKKLNIKKTNKPILGWTIRTKEEYDTYKDKYYNIICENMNLYIKEDENGTKRRNTKK